MRFSKIASDFLKSGTSYPFAKEYGKKLVNLASNESPFPPSPRVQSAIRKALGCLNLYPDPWAAELREKIANYAGVEGENVILGNGSDELLDLACRLFLDPGDRVLVPVPTFSLYEIAARLAGAHLQFWPLPEFRWRGDELIRAAGKAKMVFVCRPNNPTGNSAEEETVLELLREGKIVVVDEAYHEFARYSLVRHLGTHENLVILRTFSKAFGLAGLRIGYALAAPKVVEAMRRVKQPFSVNSLALVAASAALDDLSYMNRVVEEVRRERERVRVELLSMGLTVLESDANFLMVGGFTDADQLCRELEKEGILIRSLSGVRGAGGGWVRITVGTRSQNQRLLSALRRILR
jgi:histidinol-phosphate aminotransferase